MIYEKILRTERAQQKYRNDAYFRAALETIRIAEAGRTTLDPIESIGVLLCDLTDAIEEKNKKMTEHILRCPMHLPFGGDPPGYVI